LHDVALVVAPDGGLAAPDQLDSLSAADLVAAVYRAGAGDCDLRVLTAPGEQNLPMLRAVARSLGRDVLIAPTGSEVMRLPAAQPSTMDAEGGVPEGDDLVPVDTTSGNPVDWLTVQPSGQVGAVFGWFEVIGGLVGARTGLVALPLPDGGRMLATRETFVQERAAAMTIRVGHPDLVTVGVQVQSGNFVLGFYDRRTVLVDGAGLAAALSDLPLYRAQVRLWLSWPTAAADRRRLQANLTELAEVTGATVWAPDEPGAVVMLDGCLDLAAVDSLGEVGRWRPYGTSGPFESDVDGRLVPAGGVRVAHLSAARLVSGHPARERELASRPSPAASLDATPAGARRSFTCDLAVLADGRLAVRHRDESLVAVGGRQFAQLLRDAGWTGSDVVLLSPVAPEQAAGARRHLADLGTHLGVPIRLGAAGPAAEPLPPPTLSRPVPLQPAPEYPAPRQTAPLPTAPARPVPSHLTAPPPTRHRASRASPAPHQPTLLPHVSEEDRAWQAAMPDDPFGTPAGPVGRTRFIDGPRLMAAAPTPRHGVPWLPIQPQTNAEQFELFVACDVDPGAAIVAGVPSRDLFLTGHLDADLLAERTTAAHLLQVRIAPNGAIDVAATEVAPPADVARLLTYRDAYLLPAGWLPRCEVVATYRVTRDHASVRQSRHANAALLLRPAGAAHGVPGLPESAARWPHGRIRGANRYLVVAEPPAPPWLPLTARRPAPTQGAVLVEVRVERDQAIDVAATAAALASLPAVRSSAGELAARGIEVVLPAQAFATVTIRKAWRGDGRSWRELRLRRERRLDALLQEAGVNAGA
jgi:hypothetical protein